MTTARKILVIDDEEDLRELVKMTLESQGYEVFTAIDGIDGLEKLKGLKPDLIILDMNMPRMGGVQFYNSICEGAETPPYPIFVLTARANMEQLFKELHVNGFMAKPFEIEHLLKEIKAIMDQKEKSVDEFMISAHESISVHIIESDPEVQKKLSWSLLRAGYSVHISDCAIEGMQKVSADVPHLALIRLVMPKMTGDLIALKIKNMTKTAQVRCIVYSGQGAARGEITRRISIKDGIDRFLEYTLVDDLLPVVKEVMMK